VRPLLHFLAVGAIAAAVSGALRDDRELLVVSRERVAELEADWRRLTGAPPSAAEQADLVEHEIEDEIVFREALRRGLDRGSAHVRDRLVTTMRFLGEGGSTNDDLVREAREIGLDRTDLVIRRQLVEDLRSRLRREGSTAPVSDADIDARVTREGASAEHPPRIALTHLFFDRERRGTRAEADAHALAERLRRGDADLGVARRAGDPFVHGVELPSFSARELEARFGGDFTRAAWELRGGEWSGAVRSPYGFHVLRVDAREESRADLDASRARAAQAIRLERGVARERREIRTWRERYAVVVEEPAS
jgi:hypothetical protein